MVAAVGRALRRPGRQKPAAHQGSADPSAAALALLSVGAISLDALLTVLFGLIVGVSLGLLGGGGSVLAVPVLVYVLDEPLRTAVPTSLLVVGTTALAGAISYLRSGQVLWRTALIFGACGFGGSVVGAWANHQVDEKIVLVGYAGLMVFTARTLRRKAAYSIVPVTVGAGPSADPVPVDDWRSKLGRIALAGLAVGFVTSLFGIGGGFLITPALVVLLGVPVRAAIGTGLLILVLNAASGFASHLGYGSVDYPVAALFASAGVVGALVGSRLAARVNTSTLMRQMAHAILVVAAFVLIKTLLA